MKQVCPIIAVAALAALVLVDADLAATTSDKFGGGDITKEAENIKDFIFGPVAKTVGIMGGGYGLVSSLMSASMRPLLTFGGVGLSVAILPQFINGVFTLLLQ